MCIRDSTYTLVLLHINVINVITACVVTLQRAYKRKHTRLGFLKQMEVHNKKSKDKILIALGDDYMSV